MHPNLTHHNHSNQSAPQSVASGVSAAPFTGILGRWVSTAILKWQQRRMRQALDRLDDRMLADIGICRSDIPDLVNGLDARELRMAPVAPSRPLSDADYALKNLTA